MLSFFLSSAGFLLWSITIISIYYSTGYSSVNHIESAIGYGGYLTTIFVLYGCYKAVSLSFGWKKLSFNFFTILGITLLHILILSIVYTGFPEVKGSPFLQGVSLSGFTLFIHICTLLLYPLLLTILCRDVGLSGLNYLIPSWKDIDMRLRVLAEITIGFMIFVVGLLIIGSMGYLTLSGLMVVLLIIGLLGIPGHRETYLDIKNRKIELENHNSHSDIVSLIQPKLLSIEFGFFILTFLLGVSLINIIRPMPIGWDDLGVYMNYPKIMATTGSLLEGAAMYAWQLITSTGFLFSYTAAQAFYINQLGGILAVIAIISSLSYAFEKKGKSSLLSLPILFSSVYYAMPMTVFQQAKDMKLDPAYLFFAISGIMLLFHAWKHHKEEKKMNLLILGIIGVIIGFTFTVKFTSVMLILACLGVIAYRFLSLSGYLGFFFLFLAIFTKGNLWNMMNVPMPKDNPELLTKISIFLILASIVSFVIGYFCFKKESLDTSVVQHSWGKTFSVWIISSIVFLIGVGVGCAPWLIKNASEVGVHGLSTNPISVLSGSGGVTFYDYVSLFTEEELALKKKSASLTMTNDGKSENEDFGRYFGYEGGLNNYLKLPANLTFQKNQGGEFTDITYIFLALVPGLLLFVRGRREYTMLAGAGMLIACMAYYFFIKNTSLPLSNFFGQFSLLIKPDEWKTYGYAVLIALNFLIIALIHHGTARTETNEKLKEVFIFMGIYAFLFVIAAFGIVWYGIVVYFGFFLIMGYSIDTILSYSDEEKETKKTHLHLIIAGALFVLIATYFVRSAFPHGWNNLRNAQYNEYKYSVFNQEESIFAYRSDYLIPIATMNLKDVSGIFLGIEGKMKSAQMKDFLKSTDVKNIPLDSLHQFILKYRNTNDLAFRNDVRLLGREIYNQVLYPPKDNQNMGGIYRIGTFMTYLINENRKRYLDDSLIMLFGDYFYDPSPEKTIDRMKKVGFKFLLVDLNAATIDRDPRRALTNRAEKLLLTMNASNLRLVNTDNFCLELALSERKKGKLKTDEEFIDIAGTNSESYRNGVTIYRSQKLTNCHKYIVTIINEKRATEYPLIEAIQNEILSTNATQDGEKLQRIIAKYAGQSWFALFEIIDTPETTSVPNSGTGSISALTGSTLSGVSQ